MDRQILKTYRICLYDNRRQPNKDFFFGQTLLHKCVEYYSHRKDLIEIFLTAYPKALSKSDDTGFLPLHCALISATSTPTLELIQLLIERDPETILCPTLAGSLPLHLACQNGCHIPIVKYLMDNFPGAIRYREKQGLFPLDHAPEDSGVASSTCDARYDNVVELLVRAYPVLLSFLDDRGRLPLHRILAKRMIDKTVDLLVEYCPGALRYQDQMSGQMPLLQACCQNKTLSQVYSLVRKWPEQVTT